MKPSSQQSRTKQAVNEVEASNPTFDGRILHYFEETSHGQRKLARTEHFMGYHPVMAELLMSGTIPSLVSSAIDEDVFLYKEKINYKFSGGSGFRAHVHWREQGARRHAHGPRRPDEVAAPARLVAAGGVVGLPWREMRQGAP